ncbi:ABC-type cobalamin/Fe3+-siderophore transport system, ATPase component [Caldisphaera lagunensis DSM 15908]|uniref:ABC-type cobalamin/Fe3+-siderophore transport system, ATPase component n=1 Tax=Caldisphaera lagunensis (strain DSM 15908 / JCM 11604 / ANMR 0165 / IC-154) TaxID=1056495 RepID=L0AC84_CALLD|nr:ABC transporter ATP-binding protein [Caldisphaera lagunensis]AFZ70742.1 ABC-type cobalamin/Fe3+-siderophore transport system, ATPase component [Caldisphaera lagunensis DSM 15908]
MQSIIVKDVSFSIKDKEIIKDISFELEEGEILAILGPNGVGKTTLLKIIAGLIKPTKGEVLIYKNPPEKSRKYLSYLPANANIDQYANVEDILLAMLYGKDRKFIVGNDDIKKIKNWYFKLLEKNYLKTSFNNLSSGEQRLVLLSGCFAREPKIILLDEPTAFLDITNQAKILRFIKEMALKMNITVIFTMHEIYYANIANKVLLMKNGKIKSYGKPSDVLKKDIIDDVYKIDVLEIPYDNKKIFFPSVF